MPPAEHYDVVVVGAGPSGAASAYWLARCGWHVALLERKHFPRPKTCGDALTPRAVRQLEAMGLGTWLEGRHRFAGLRSLAAGRSMTLAWPDHPELPSQGAIVERRELDQIVAANAERAGATLLQGHEALGVEVTPGCAEVEVRSDASEEPIRLSAEVVVVADGANSRIGRALGASRRRDWPLGMAIRTYLRSPRADEATIESHLEIRDPVSKRPMPGYGWVFPMGDGRVNVGIGLLSVGGRNKTPNTSHLLEHFVEQVRGPWSLVEDPLAGAPTGGKLPMGLAVGPRHGPRHLLVGDAAGAVNPFNGEGIAYGYETGRLGALVVDQALRSGDLAALAAWEEALDDALGSYYAFARTAMRVIGRPEVLGPLLQVGMRSERLMGSVLRIMSNMLRPDELAPTELVAKGAAAALSALSPLGSRLASRARPQPTPLP
jgi:geranylgeranyl reductase family protein